MSDDEEVIEISSDEEVLIDRRAILEPVVRRVVDALGGLEGGVYIFGDEVSGCLRDLKKLWRKDDTDDERTVARIFWDTRVLPNDFDTHPACNGSDDLAYRYGRELKELDEELDKGTDYTQLALSHLTYKAALMKPEIMKALFGIALPPLTMSPRTRTPRDTQIINVVLHLVRNLAFIKDLPANMNLSADQAEFSSLQSRLIRVLSESHLLDLLLTIATNADDDPMFTALNTLVLEIFYLLFRGIKPTVLTMDQAKQPAENLHRLLASEERTRRDSARKASSRHSRFGTTIAVTLKDKTQSVVLHRQQAISREAGDIMDISKRQKSRKGNKMDELAREDNLTVEAKVILQDLARDFMESCFNPFLAALLKDIKSERAKITEKDNLRLLYVTQWFLEFFLVSRAKDPHRWEFGLVAEVTERGWIVWVLKRMREAVEDKPKLWTELQAGIECLTQLLLLIETMSATDIDDDSLRDAAELLQQQLIYNGEVLDIAFESLRSYKTGTQSLAYLDASVYLAFALLRMLERWSKVKNGDVYVRRKKARRKKTNEEETGVPEEEDYPEDVPEEPTETTFTFEAFEMKFANAEITHTLLTYLARYNDFESSENMRRVVSLMHRQAVRAKAEGFFFQVSTLNLFKTILADQKTFPKETPYKDLVTLINYILRKFFKRLEEDSFVAVEVFFPKNRATWKKFSSWVPEEKAPKANRSTAEFPAEVQIKKGYSWSEQMGIAIASLVEDGHMGLIDWVKEILTLVTGMRQRTIEAINGRDEGALIGDDEDDEDAGPKVKLGPSDEAISKLTDYMIPYVSDEQAEAATKNSKLKLMFRLVKFFVMDENAEELEWYVPAGILPSDMNSSLAVINQFLETPFDLDGKKAASLLSKKTTRRSRRRAPSPGSDEDLDLDEFDQPRKQKKERKKKEKEQYKSAQLIEDSDEEYGDIEAFLEKEKVTREKAAALAAAGGKSTTMKATGTKKRKGNKRKRKDAEDAEDEDVVVVPDSDEEDEDKEEGEEASKPKPKPKAKPRPRPLKRAKTQSSRGSSPAPGETLDSTDDKALKPRPRPRPIKKAKTSTAVSSPPPTNPSSDHIDISDSDKEDAPNKGESPDLVASTMKKKRLAIVVSDDED